MSNVLRTAGSVMLLSFLLLQLSGCGRSMLKWKLPPERKPKAQDQDAAKSFSARLTFPPLAGEIYVINPDFACPGNPLMPSNTLLSRIFSGEDLPGSDQSEPQTLNFRKSFQTQNQFGVLETFWVDFLFPIPVFKRLYQATPSDQLQRLYQAVLFLSIPVPNRVSTYFFSKNHLITTQAEFFWTNRTYLLLFLFREYHNLYLTLKAALPPKSEVLDFLSSLSLSPTDRALVDQYLTFLDPIPSVMTLSLVLGCHQQVLVHGRPPPCDFLYQHMSSDSEHPPITSQEHASYACPVPKFMRGPQRVVWSYLCARSSQSTCPELDYASFDPNDPYLKFHIHFYANSPPTGLFCPISQDPEGPGDLAIVMDSSMTAEQNTEAFECTATTLDRLQTTYIRAVADQGTADHPGSFPNAKNLLDSIFQTWEVYPTHLNFMALFADWDAHKYATTGDGSMEESFVNSLPDVTTPTNESTHLILSRMAQAGEGVLVGNYSHLGSLFTSLEQAAQLGASSPEQILSVITTGALPAPSPSPSPDTATSDGGETSGGAIGPVVAVSPSPSPSPDIVIPDSVPSPSPDTSTSDGGETSSGGTIGPVVAVSPSPYIVIPDPAPSPDTATGDGETTPEDTTGSVVTVAPSPSPSPYIVIPDPAPSPVIIPENTPPFITGHPEFPVPTPTPPVTAPPETPDTPTIETPPPETPPAGTDSPDQPLAAAGLTPLRHCVIHPEPPHEVITWWVIR